MVGVPENPAASGRRPAGTRRAPEATVDQTSVLIGTDDDDDDLPPFWD